MNMVDEIVINNKNEKNKASASENLYKLAALRCEQENLLSQVSPDRYVARVQSSAKGRSILKHISEMSKDRSSL